MIVSHEHKYVFIQFPHTACTAVGRELVEYYGGQPVLYKHAAYHDFLRWAGPKEKEYFAFSSIRNPLDEMISFYYKLKTDHNGDFSNPAKRKENGGWVNYRIRKRFDFVYGSQLSFCDYLRRFHMLPYVNWSVLAHKKLDYVMRYERLQDEFSAVLARLGLEQVRPLPLVNATSKEDRSPLEELAEVDRHTVQWVFGPLMEYWGYDWPVGWRAAMPNTSAQLGFALMRAIKTSYWKYIR